MELKFPAPVYADTVIGVNFVDAQKYFLEPLLEIHYAHTLMLTKQGIIPAAVALCCIDALDGLDRAALATVPWDGRSEDLFFFIEKELEATCGVSNAGRMHTARSRNDIDITQYRILLRRQILELYAHLGAARAVLIDLAHQHTATIMPAYTHTQPAQPITFSHYLLAVIELMGRDQKRLAAAFATVNRCPMGACAISTTGFPIDREYTASLLGFAGLQLNSYGAIAATDYLTETMGAIATAMVNLGRVTQDFLLWCTAEFGYFRLSDAWVQISSIMPQKRNPVPFEHVRVIASKALAQAQGVFNSLHNTPFGDINDAEDDLQPLVFGAVADAIRALRIFGGVMPDCQVNKARMADRAAADFLTVTELADTLVRSEDISFREAHRIVSAAVKSLAGHYSASGMVDAALKLAPEIIGKPIVANRAELMEALDPAHFIAIRGIPGGPGPEPMKAALALADADAKTMSDWLSQKQTAMAAYPVAIRAACDELKKS